MVPMNHSAKKDKTNIVPLSFYLLTYLLTHLTHYDTVNCPDIYVGE